MFVKINRILDLPRRSEHKYIIGSKLGLKREDIDHCNKSADVFEKVRQQNPTVTFKEFVCSVLQSKSEDIRHIICQEFHNKTNSDTVTSGNEGVTNRARDNSLNTDEELSEMEDKVGQPLLKPNIDIMRPGKKRSRTMSLPDRLSTLARRESKDIC